MKNIKNMVMALVLGIGVASVCAQLWNSTNKVKALKINDDEKTATINNKVLTNNSNAGSEIKEGSSEKQKDNYAGGGCSSCSGCSVQGVCGFSK